MMIAEFIHFYPSYTVESVLAMYAVTFYALLAAMYRLKGASDMQAAYRTAVAFNGGDQFTEYIEASRKQAGGIKTILDQVKIVRGVKK